MSNKAKLTVNFLAYPSVKIRKFWQTGNKCFTSVGARLFRDIYLTSFFCSIKRQKLAEIEKNQKNTAFTNYI